MPPSRLPAAARPAPGAPATRDSSALGWVVVLASVGAATAFLGLDAFVGLPGRGVGSTISAYVYTPGAWVFRLAVLALAAAAALLVLALTRRGTHRAWSVPMVLLTLTVLGLAAVAVFPKTDWAAGDTIYGRLHRIGSMVAFLAPPVATLLLTRRGSRSHDGHPALRGAFWASLGVVATLGAAILLAVLAVRGGGMWWTAFPLGTIERTVVGFELLAMAFMGVWLARSARGSAPALAPGATDPLPTQTYAARSR